LNPDDDAAWYYKGVAMNNLERPEEALEALSRSIELNPDDAAAWLIKGEVLRKLDKNEEALEAFSKSLEERGLEKG
jgi:tetratricopeptide (TPR) repeat protein